MNGWKLKKYISMCVCVCVILFALLVVIFLFFLPLRKQWIQCLWLFPRSKAGRDWHWPPTPTWCEV